MPVVILDADFLSSFLKIGRVSLIQNLFPDDEIVVSSAVFREVARTQLLPDLIAASWIRLRTPDADDSLRDRLTEEELQTLGAGEQESMALALKHPGSVLLISDNKARKAAMGLGINAVNIPAFLLAGKERGLLNREVIEAIIQELREKDFYEFRKDVLPLLLS